MSELRPEDPGETPTLEVCVYRNGVLVHRELCESEADAAAATERMSLPIVALMTGFLIFLGFPAVAAVMTGL